MIWSDILKNKKNSMWNHIRRVRKDNGNVVRTAELLALMENNNVHKDSIKLAFCPELYGTKFRTASNINYFTKGYSTNSVNQELGAELIVNGDFSNGTTGWTNISSSSEIINGCIRITNTQAAAGYAYQSIQLQQDVRYRFKCDRIIGNAGSPSLALLSATPYDFALNVLAGGASISEFIYTPTSTGIYYLGIGIRLGSLVGNYGGFDNVSCRVFFPNDITQTVASLQPFLDKIAPTEKLSVKNPNGGNKFLTHPTIGFGVNDEWTSEVVLNWNGSNNSIVSFAGKQSDTLTSLGLKDTTNVISFTNESGTKVNGMQSTTKFIGKTTVFHFIALGDGMLKVYANGVLFDTILNSTNVSFSSCVKGQATAGREFYGTMYEVPFYNNKALSLTQISTRYTMLRSMFPEITAVTIGSQTWAVRNFEVICTPQGTLIPEVQSNTAWNTSQTLYDNAYAAQSGTVEQKTYAGVKAAAMWCHYDNTIENGAIYGKLYNWFAVKLLQMDIDEYNAANPTAQWGWRVPTQADYQQLSTTLGGSNVSGGKLKITGTQYWGSPNTGATNESGFSATCGGFRSPTTGAFSNRAFYCDFATITETINHSARIEVSYIDTKMAFDFTPTYNCLKGHARTLRLIKTT